MAEIQWILVGVALAGLGLAVLLEIRRGKKEDRMWADLRERLAQDITTSA